MGMFGTMMVGCTSWYFIMHLNEFLTPLKSKVYNVNILNVNYRCRACSVVTAMFLLVPTESHQRLQETYIDIYTTEVIQKTQTVYLSEDLRSKSQPRASKHPILSATSTTLRHQCFQVARLVRSSLLVSNSAAGIGYTMSVDLHQKPH